MSAVDLKAEINRYLDQIDDQTFLRVVHSMLDTYVHQQEEDPVVGYDVDGTPKRASEMKEQLRQEVEKANRGEYTSIDDLHDKSEQWLSRHIK